MELTQALASRRSVRQYTPQPVEKATLEQLIQAATLAPSAMNLQPWAFGVLQGTDALRELSARAKADLLAKLHLMPAIEHYRETLSNPDFCIFYNAPALVVIYAKSSTDFASGDCCLAAENLMLAACDKGLGTCWIGFSLMYLNLPEVKAEFHVPAEYQVVSALIVGYPTDGPVPPKERNAPEILFWK